MSFLELRFLVKMALLALRGLFERLPKPKGPFSREYEAQEIINTKTPGTGCSVLGNIRDVSWHLSKRGRELEKR